MRQYEYRIETLTLENNHAQEQLLALLNEFGEQGWRVSNLEALTRRTNQPNSMRILFERRIRKIKRRK